jgi:hypothetical protein
MDLGQISELIKRTAYKVTRVGELIGREVADTLKIQFGAVDLSLAPTPNVGDSVGEIFPEPRPGGHRRSPAPPRPWPCSTTPSRKGGAFASSHVGGLSGAFIPVSEDLNISAAAEAGHLTIEKLEAITSVCSVGLDMVAIPGDTSAGDPLRHHRRRNGHRRHQQEDHGHPHHPGPRQKGRRIGLFRRACWASPSSWRSTTKQAPTRSSAAAA